MTTTYPVPPMGNMGAPTVVSSAAPRGGVRQPYGGAPAQGAYGQPYRTDAYRSSYGSQSFGPAMPIQYLANDWRQPVNYVAMRIARRLDALGVNNTTDLLKRADSRWQRSALATMVAAFDRTVTKSMATQWINYWLGTSDLLRTGMSIDTARLLQSSGIADVPSLSRYWDPMSRLSLYGTLTSNAIRFGYRMPSWQEFSMALDASRSLPMAIRW